MTATLLLPVPLARQEIGNGDIGVRRSLSTIPARGWLLPSLIPIFNHRERARTEGRHATGAMRCTQPANKILTRKSLGGVARMANATETQAGGLDPDLSQNGSSHNGDGRRSASGWLLQ